MARIPATSNRSTKNVRNGPSKWQQRLSTLLREARWVVFLLLAAWLSLVLFTWNSSDPAWSVSLHAGTIHNQGGKFGASVADILYFLFGYSAWLWVVLLLYQLVIGFYHITSIVLPSAKIQEPLPRVPWELGIGFGLFFIGCIGFEALQLRYGVHLPAGSGGQIGQLLTGLLVTYFGVSGAIITLLLAITIGASWFFSFSWLNVAEKIGKGVEYIFLKIAAIKGQIEDRRAGQASIAERQESIATKQVQRQQEPVREEPILNINSNSTPQQRIEPSIGAFAQDGDAHKSESSAKKRAYKNPIFDDPTPTASVPLEHTTEPAVADEPFESLVPNHAPDSYSDGGLDELPKHIIQTQTQVAVVKAAKVPTDVGRPPLDLLDPAEELGEPISADTLEYTSRLIEKKLSDFGINVSVMEALSGPVITRYEIEPATGVKGNQIVNLSKDLARSLSLVDIRVVETIPGKNLMGLELPNPKRQMVRLEEIIGSTSFVDSKSLLTVALGKDIAGHAVVADLARMPHLLVAGTTGSGKSVGINAMILSILYKATPDQVRLILIDPKMLEMSVYEDIPHLLAPVVTDMREAANALTWCVNEMERRYKLMSKMGVRNLAGFNSKITEAKDKGENIPNPFSLTPDAPEPLEELPFIVVVIDELADLMMVAGKKIEELIARLAQKARAAGIHLVLATQRPSVDVITGLIKANIPTRISFQVSSRIDSRTILDQMGAESLLGQGDMLYLPPGTSLPIRVHGAFVDDNEVHRVVDYLKEQGEPEYIEGILEGGAPGETGDGLNAVTGFADPESDPLYDQAVAVVMETNRASISGVQRQLRVGYNRAARLIEEMERAGIVSSMRPNGVREILVPINKD